MPITGKNLALCLSKLSDQGWSQCYSKVHVRVAP